MYSRETLAVARAFGNCGRMFYCRGCRAKEISEGCGKGAAGTEKLRSQRPAVEVRNESPDGGAQGRIGGQSSGAPKTREAVAAPFPHSSDESTSRALPGGQRPKHTARAGREGADRPRPGTSHTSCEAKKPGRSADSPGGAVNGLSGDTPKLSGEIDAGGKHSAGSRGMGAPAETRRPHTNEQPGQLGPAEVPARGNVPAGAVQSRSLTEKPHALDSRGTVSPRAGTN